MGLGERIKARMEEAGLSQSELARRVGLRQSTISALIHGTSYGSKHLHLIARELRTTPSYLSGEVDDPHLDAPEPPTLTAGELEWVEVYRALDDRSRAALLQIGRTMITGVVPPTVNVLSAASGDLHKRTPTSSIVKGRPR